jgi:hypothetical protein
MDSTISKVLLDILLLVVSAGIGWVGLYLKKRWGIEKTKDIMSKVKTAVQAAELIGASLGYSGADKKQWVIEYVSKIIKIDAGQLNAFIESAVSELKAQGAELELKESKTGASSIVVKLLPSPTAKK